MYKFLPTLLLIILSLTIVQSQQTIRCNIDDRAPSAYADYPAFLKSVEKSMQAFNDYGPQKSSSVVITIPVHVILVHNPGQAIGTGTNFSIEHVQSQIDVLNEDFRRLNGDASNTPAEFAAGDSEIEFCLASVDPDGNPTDGITRYATTQNMNSNETAIKAATGWDRNSYLNIWSAPNLGSLLGWAYLPSTTNLPNATLDGVVCAAGSFGGPGYATNNPYHLGRTATHEVGHYLGLRHIWRNDGCNSDDGFADTPLQDDEYFGCPSHPQVSCGSNDMFMNYMDYVNDNCMNAFSVLQGDYMQTILNTSRSSLLNAASTLCSTTAALVLEIVGTTDVFCFGEATGSLEVEASGGVPPYSYSINGGSGQGSGLFTDLVSGNYVIIVTDDNGNTASNEIFIESSIELQVEVNSVQNNTCAGFDQGNVILQISGGISPYFVDGQAASGNQYLISGLAAGSYSSIVMDSEACEASIEYEISEPLPVFVTIDQVVDVSCFGDQSGEVSFTIFGGTPDYQVLLEGVPIGTNSVQNLTAGIYEIQAFDALGCLGENTFEISEPDFLVADVEFESITCAGVDEGSAILLAAGGTMPYSYAINNSPFGASPSFEGLEAGSYTGQILDAEGCIAETTFTIEEGYSIVLSEQDIINPSCGNAASGFINVQAEAGMEPYTYLLLANGQSNNTGEFMGLVAGTYEIVASDNNGCITAGTWTLLDEAALELAIETVGGVDCQGASTGSIEVSSSNSEGNVEYSIDGINYQSDGLFQNLSAGSYIVNGTDASGCFTQVMVEVTENPTIELMVESTSISCHNGNDGMISITASGGVSEFVYAGNNTENETGLFDELMVGVYNFTITDAAGCRVDTTIEITNIPALEIVAITVDSTSCFGASDGSINTVNVNNTQGDFTSVVLNEEGEEVFPSMLPAGIYTVLVEDSKGCTASAITEIHNQAPIEWEILEQSDANCDGTIRGNIQVQATAGVPPYAYSVGQITNMTGFFDNFNAGMYALTITDASACTNIVQFTIGQTDGFDYEVSAINPISCFDMTDGSVQLSVEDTGTYTYRMNGEENQNGLFENLGAGTYPYEIEDAVACTISDIVNLEGPDLLAIVDVAEMINMNDLTDVEVSVTGGTTPYQYRLNEGSWQATGLFTDLENGTYIIDVIDANGCEVAITQVILDINTETQASWNVYPNPFGDDLFIEWDSDEAADMNIRLMNIVGHQIGNTWNKSFPAAGAILRLDCAHIPTGVYLVLLEVEGALYHKRVVKR